MSLDSTLRARINDIDRMDSVHSRLESLENGQSYLVQRTQDIKLLKDEIMRELKGQVRIVPYLNVSWPWNQHLLTTTFLLNLVFI